MRLSLTTTIIFSLPILSTAIPKLVVKSNITALKLTKYAPFPNPDSDTVDVNILNVHIASLTAYVTKVLRSFDNYEKNMGMTHLYAKNDTGIRKRGAGAALASDREKIWYTELSIGTPPETFSVEVDTGSSDMFVPYYLCDDSCDGHTLWDPDESETAKSMLRGFSIAYADGSSVSGRQYVDNVTISGFTADEQTIGAAKTYSTQLHKDNWAPDGMLGMAFHTLSTYPAKPLFATLAESDVIEPVFSLKLTSDGGELYIGGVNPELYKGEFTYTPVTEQAFWQVEIQSIQDDKGNMALTNVPATIDTGTTLIIGDPTRVSNMYKVLGGMYVGDGYYCFRCNSFPAVSFSFNGKAFEIPPELLKLGKISSGSNECFSSIVAKDTGASFWIIGAAFLRGYYTTFEFGEHPRVGFAELQS